MALPRAVREQAENAEKIQQQLNANRNGSQEVIDPQPPGKQTPPDLDQVDWEHRWKTLKVSHDNTVTELRDENRLMSGQIDELKTLVERAASKSPAAQEVEFTPEEVDEYGEDFLNMVKRVAASMTGGQDDSKVAEELRELKGQFGELVNHQAKSKEDHFYDELEVTVPDWEKVNENQQFKDWLAEEMPNTGQERQKFLATAQQRFDAKTVISIFNSWKGEVGLPTYFPDTITTVEGDVVIDQGNQDTTIFTGAEIAQFYDDRRRGRFKGREEEGRQLEARIFQAQKENRVR
jgi:hypothetical protein